MSLLQSINMSWRSFAMLLLFKLSFPFASIEPIFAIFDFAGLANFLSVLVVCLMARKLLCTIFTI